MTLVDILQQDLSEDETLAHVETLLASGADPNAPLIG